MTFFALKLTERFVTVPVETPPSDADTLEFLKMYKRLYSTPEGEHYVFNPNSFLVPILCEMRLIGYKERFALVNAARKDKLKEDPFSNVAKTIYLEEGQKGKSE